MKYLKTFENKNEKKAAWKIPYKENDYPIYLWKLGVPEKTTKNLLNDKQEQIDINGDPFYDWIYIIYNEEKKLRPWGWVEPKNPFIKDNFKILHTPKITEEDRKNYQINQLVDKYNL